jgi:hypothetical protein
VGGRGGNGGLAGLLPSALQFLVTSDVVLSGGGPGAEQPGPAQADPFLWSPPPVAAGPAGGGGIPARGAGVFGGFPSPAQVLRPPPFAPRAPISLLKGIGVAL